MADRKDPFRSFRFRVEIDGINQAGFTDVTLPDSSVDPVEYREGTDKYTRKLAGFWKEGNVSLKWGITDSTQLYDWYKSCKEGNVQRKNVAIKLMDENDKEVASWTFDNAWPIKYKAPDFSAKTHDVGIENLEVVHEGMKRTK
jgi:phage tail-like protein